MELMIADSTFDPRLSEVSPDTANLTGNALARSLGLSLDGVKPVWRQDHDARRGERLGRMAADIDTANVGEAFSLLGRSALQLAEEQLMRRHLSPEQPESAEQAFSFLILLPTALFFRPPPFFKPRSRSCIWPAKTG